MSNCQKPDLMAHAFNSSTQAARARTWLSIVLGQPGLYNKFRPTKATIVKLCLKKIRFNTIHDQHLGCKFLLMRLICQLTVNNSVSISH